MSDRNLNRIFELYQVYGQSDYIGENVTQIEHALQCAKLAEDSNQNDYVILGSFLHDVGHLVGEANKTRNMVSNGINYGKANHEKMGSNFLRNCNVPEKICYIVENHVATKRYLVYKNPTYHDKLSEASKQTLIFQGGPMNESEAIEFQKNESFDALIKLRTWDDQAKNTELNLAANSEQLLAKYKQMLEKLIQN